jgi:hypothetical protein
MIWTEQYTQGEAFEKISKALGYEVSVFKITEVHTALPSAISYMGTGASGNGFAPGAQRSKVILTTKFVGLISKARHIRLDQSL